MHFCGKWFKDLLPYLLMTTFNEYNDSKIYGIFCNETNDVYIGSTCKSIHDRLKLHIIDSVKETVTTTSKEIIKRNNYIVKLIEHINCETKEELHIKEKKYIKEYISDKSFNCVNKYMTRTDEENLKHRREQSKIYYEKNREKIKEYFLKNREKYNEYKKQYRKNNQEKIKEYNQNRRPNPKIKEETQEMKEKRLENVRTYYKKNKDKINEQRAMKVPCECGCMVVKRQIARHKKTSKHVKLMNAMI